MAFAGIPLAALDFYEDLEADNSKAFWTEHKHVYDEQVKAPLQALAEALAKDFGAPKFFRPYRDVRFSKDKTPYKTHQGIWFGETSTYVQVGGGRAVRRVRLLAHRICAGRAAAPRRRRRPAGRGAGEGARRRAAQGFRDRR